MPDSPSPFRGRGRADRISTSIPAELTTELRARASDQGRSLSNLCAQVLAGWVEDTRSED
ncbi:MAG: hypothetical protein ACKOE9_04680 [Vulcanococcus sp.]